jgi:hypothetical protein
MLSTSFLTTFFFFFFCRRNQQLLSGLKLVAEITVPLITVSVPLMYWRRKIRIALGVGNVSDGNGIIDIELANLNN